jgi:AraC-like DNA-binding protein
LPGRQNNKTLSIASVRNVIEDLLPSGRANLAHTADALQMSTRTLQRRLAERGLDYSSLVEQVRFARAREMICQRVKISEVAVRVGYGDSGSFTRAFERWSGVSPMKYRAGHGSKARPGLKKN